MKLIQRPTINVEAPTLNQRQVIDVDSTSSFQRPSNFQIQPYFNIGIKHGFSCINVCQVPREVLKTEAEGRGFQHLPRDLANVNVLENNV